MELTWYGLSCFRMTERGAATIITDPYSPKIGLPPLKLKSDVVTISHDASGHNSLKGVIQYEHAFSRPGEFEVGGVFIHGIASPRDAVDNPPNTMYVFNYSNVSIAHLGDLSGMLTQSQIDELGQVNILLLPVGGGNTLTASQASELVALIEPNIVIPMHYAIKGLKIELSEVDKFLKEMGVADVQEENSLKITGKSNLPEEGTQVVILQPRV